MSFHAAETEQEHWMVDGKTLRAPAHHALPDNSSSWVLAGSNSCERPTTHMLCWPFLHRVVECTIPPASCPTACTCTGLGASSSISGPVLAIEINRLTTLTSQPNYRESRRGKGDRKSDCRKKYKGGEKLWR